MLYHTEEDFAIITREFVLKKGLMNEHALFSEIYEYVESLGILTEEDLKPTAVKGSRNLSYHQKIRNLKCHTNKLFYRDDIISVKNGFAVKDVDLYDDLMGTRFNEGEERNHNSKTYKRSKLARDECIEYYGNNCALCGISFEDVYGPEMAGYIQVHHTIPLSEGERETNPKTDLIPLCPNCHTTAHRTKRFTLDELKKIYNKKD